MSWDIFILDLPENARTTKEIPNNFEPQMLGKRDAIIQKIQALIPDADFSDTSRGRIDGDGFSIDVSISEEDVQSMALFVRGDNDAVLDSITKILKSLNGRAIAANSNIIFDDASMVADAFNKWRGYRNQLIDS